MQYIWEIAINNGWNKHIFQILFETRDGEFLFIGKFPSREPKPFGLSNECIRNNFKYQETEFYSRLFDESEHGPFEVPPRRKKKYDKNEYLILLSCMFYRKIRVLMCSVNCNIKFTSSVIKFLLITPSLKKNYRHKFFHDVELNNVIKKGKT